MKKILFLALIMSFTCSLIATQKYNSFENRWETVPEDWQVKYNSFENNWSYQPDNAKVEYNPFENSWDWNSGHNSYNTNYNTSYELCW